MFIMNNYQLNNNLLNCKIVELIVLHFLYLVLFFIAIDTFYKFHRILNMLQYMVDVSGERRQLTLYHDVHGDWPDDKYNLKSNTFDNKRSFNSSGENNWVRKSFQDYLNDYQMNGAFINNGVDFESDDSVDVMDKGPIIIGGSITFSWGIVKGPQDILLLLSFRPVSSEGPSPPSFYWSCGEESVDVNLVAYGPNYTNIPKGLLLSVCR